MLQYINDQNGKASGVFISIDEWEKLKKEFHISIDPIDFIIPDWHKKIVLDRINSATQNDYINADDFFQKLDKEIK